MPKTSDSATVFDSIDSRLVHPTEIVPVMSQSQNNAPSTSQSYSTIARTATKAIFPTKSQAIIIDAKESYKLFDYVESLGTIVDPKNITFASRISNNRICIYLSSAKLVDSLMKSPNIKLGNTEIPIRRLVTPAKRIVISNAHPIIPHDVIEESLKKMNLKIVSPVSYLRAGMPKEGFTHLLSFRRQVYVSANEDNQTVFPSSIMISFDDSNYRLYLTTDSMECYRCRKPGHLAKNCKEPDKEITAFKNPQSIESKKRPLSSNTPRGEGACEQNSLAAFEGSPTSPSSDTTSNKPQPEDSKKRPLPSNTPTNEAAREQSSRAVFEEVPPSVSTDQLPNITLGPPASQAPRKPKAKKLKKGTLPKKADHPESYKVIGGLYDEDPSQYTVPFYSFISFLEDSQDSSDPLTVGRRFTTDIESLLKTMKVFYSKIPDRSLKNKFTRVSKRIRKQLQEEGMEVASCLSLSSLGSIEDTDTSHMELSDTS